MKVPRLSFCEFMHNYQKKYAAFNVTQEKPPTLAAKNLIYNVLTTCYVNAIS